MVYIAQKRPVPDNTGIDAFNYFHDNKSLYVLYSSPINLQSRITSITEAIPFILDDIIFFNFSFTSINLFKPFCIC